MHGQTIDNGKVHRGISFEFNDSNIPLSEIKRKIQNQDIHIKLLPDGFKLIGRQSVSGVLQNYHVSILTLYLEFFI